MSSIGHAPTKGVEELYRRVPARASRTNVAVDAGSNSPLNSAARILGLQGYAGNSALAVAQRSDSVRFRQADKIDVPRGDSGATSHQRSDTSARSVADHPVGVVAQRDVERLNRAETDQYRGQLEAASDAVSGITPNFTDYATRSSGFISSFRARAGAINKTYSATYDAYQAHANQIGKDVKKREAIAKCVIEIAQIAGGAGTGKLLVEAISGAIGISEKLLETGYEVGKSGVGLLVELRKIDTEKEAVSGNTPDFSELPSLRRLDDLNAAIVPVLAEGATISSILVEIDRLQKSLGPDGGGAGPAGNGKIPVDEFKDRFGRAMTVTQKLEEVGSALPGQIEKFENLGLLLKNAPIPDGLRCEQDLWIIWCIDQESTITQKITGTPISVATPYLKSIGVMNPGPRGLVEPDLFLASEDDIKEQAKRMRSDDIAPYWARVWLN